MFLKNRRIPSGVRGVSCKLSQFKNSFFWCDPYSSIGTHPVVQGLFVIIGMSSAPSARVAKGAMLSRAKEIQFTALQFGDNHMDNGFFAPKFNIFR